MSKAAPLVGVIMGSDSDLPVMQAAADTLAEFGIAHEVRIISAHRTPEEMLTYARTAEDRGLRTIIAGAGGAAHLPGMVASATPLPVIVPVATVAIDNACNAGLLAVRMLAISDDSLRARMTEFQATQAEKVRQRDKAMQADS